MTQWTSYIVILAGHWVMTNGISSYFITDKNNSSCEMFLQRLVPSQDSKFWWPLPSTPNYWAGWVLQPDICDETRTSCGGAPQRLGAVHMKIDFHIQFAYVLCDTTVALWCNTAVRTTSSCYIRWNDGNHDKHSKRYTAARYLLEAVTSRCSDKKAVNWWLAAAQQRYNY